MWHHGCYSQTANCFSNNADGALESPINLSSTNAGSKIQTRLEFDLEGSSYDNFCIELSTNNGTTWTDISSQLRLHPHVGLVVQFPEVVTLLMEQQYMTNQEDLVLDFSIPSTMIGATGNSKIRFVVNTDSSVQYGSPNDAREGLTVDWFKVINSSGTTLYSNLLANSSSANSYGINGAANDWSFIK